MFLYENITGFCLFHLRRFPHIHIPWETHGSYCVGPLVVMKFIRIIFHFSEVVSSHIDNVSSCRENGGHDNVIFPQLYNVTWGKSCYNVICSWHLPLCTFSKASLMFLPGCSMFRIRILKDNSSPFTGQMSESPSFHFSVSCVCTCLCFPSGISVCLWWWQAWRGGGAHSGKLKKRDCEAFRIYSERVNRR